MPWCPNGCVFSNRLNSPKLSHCCILEGNESFQPINCTVTDNKHTITKKTLTEKHKYSTLIQENCPNFWNIQAKSTHTKTESESEPKGPSSPARECLRLYTTVIRNTAKNSSVEWMYKEAMCRSISESGWLKHCYTAAYHCTDLNNDLRAHDMPCHSLLSYYVLTTLTLL